MSDYYQVSENHREIERIISNESDRALTREAARTKDYLAQHVGKRLIALSKKYEDDPVSFNYYRDKLLDESYPRLYYRRNK